MKRKIVTIISGFLLLGACHKKDELPVKTGDGYWTIPYVYKNDGTYFTHVYPINYTTRSFRNNYAVLSGMDCLVSPFQKDADSLNFWFVKMPAVSKRYRIANFTTNTRLAETEVGITAHLASPRTDLVSSGFPYGPDWINPDSVTVTVNNGKIRVDIPNLILAAHYYYPDSQDSAVIMGKVLIEK